MNATPFRIAQDLSQHFNVIFDRSAEVSMSGAGARVAVETTRGLANPANAILPVLGMHAPDATITTGRLLTGEGAAGLDDAVRSLLALGTKHGVTGVDLSSNTFRLAGHTESLGGGAKELLAIGHPNLDAIAQAASHVMEYAR
jgi:hypothetical protein